jgi:hypothetical protein
MTAACPGTWTGSPRLSRPKVLGMDLDAPDNPTVFNGLPLSWLLSWFATNRPSNPSRARARIILSLVFFTFSRACIKRNPQDNQDNPDKASYSNSLTPSWFVQVRRNCPGLLEIRLSKGAGRRHLPLLRRIGAVATCTSGEECRSGSGFHLVCGVSARMSFIPGDPDD